MYSLIACRFSCKQKYFVFQIYHLQHLGKAPPSDSDYSEMICDQCMKKNVFLSAYLDEPVQVTGNY